MRKNLAARKYLRLQYALILLFTWRVIFRNRPPKTLHWINFSNIPAMACQKNLSLNKAMGLRDGVIRGLGRGVGRQWVGWARGSWGEY